MPMKIWEKILEVDNFDNLDEFLKELEEFDRRAVLHLKEDQNWEWCMDEDTFKEIISDYKIASGSTRPKTDFGHVMFEDGSSQFSKWIGGKHKTAGLRVLALTAEINWKCKKELKPTDFAKPTGVKKIASQEMMEYMWELSDYKAKLLDAILETQNAFHKRGLFLNVAERLNALLNSKRIQFKKLLAATSAVLAWLLSKPAYAKVLAVVVGAIGTTLIIYSNYHNGTMEVGVNDNSIGGFRVYRDFKTTDPVMDRKTCIFEKDDTDDGDYCSFTATAQAYSVRFDDVTGYTLTIYENGVKRTLDPSLNGVAFNLPANEVTVILGVYTENTGNRDVRVAVIDNAISDTDMTVGAKETDSQTRRSAEQKGTDQYNEEKKGVPVNVNPSEKQGTNSSAMPTGILHVGVNDIRYGGFKVFRDLETTAPVVDSDKTPLDIENDGYFITSSLKSQSYSIRFDIPSGYILTIYENGQEKTLDTARYEVVFYLPAEKTTTVLGVYTPI